MEVLTAAIMAVVLFVFGLEHFSKEIQRVSGERFRKFLAKATRLPAVGVVLGAFVTAVVQSSSATSVIAIGLVNAGVLSFKNSVGIIFGANVGTTVTAQLVAFKLTAFAPAFIIVGFFLSFFRSRFAVFGKSIFYFGFLFFALNLISTTLAPLQADPRVVGLLTEAQNPFIAILVGAIFTALVQSSSVTTGLAVILTQQGILGLENAIPLIMGANIGTTTTAAIAMFQMDIAAKKTALCHFLFNVGGVLLFLPVLSFVIREVKEFSTDPAIALANFHLIFNVGTSLFFLLLINPFTRLVDSMLGEGRMDFERIDLSDVEGSNDPKNNISLLRKKMPELFQFLEGNYNLVALSIESNFKNVSASAEKRIEYIDFVHGELTLQFSKTTAALRGEDNSKEFLKLLNCYDYLFQIHDSIADLQKSKKKLDETFVDVGADVLILVRELSSATLALMQSIVKDFSEDADKKIKQEAKDLQESINSVNEEMLKLMATPNRKDVSALMSVVTYSQRLKDKLINFHKVHSSLAS